MNKYTKSIITFSLLINIIISATSVHAVNLCCIYTNINKIFKSIEAFHETSYINNTTDIFSIKDDDELDWYYVRNGKDQIPDPPRESASFLKENSAHYIGDTSKKVLYLTLEEGHENNNTSQILDTLKAFNIPATFFVTKPFIEKHPDLIKRMVAEGHIVGNHSVHHIPMTQIHDKDKFAEEINGVAEAYKKVTGNDMPKFFRPPDWKYSKNSLRMIKDLGYKTIFWSFAFKDWYKEHLSEDYIVDKIVSGAHPGAIISLYSVSDKDTHVLGTAIKRLMAEGYEFKSLYDLPTQ